MSPTTSRPRRPWRTLAALLFAVASVAWSVTSIRTQIAERRAEALRQAASREPRRGMRPGGPPDMQEERPLSAPRAFAALAHRRPTSDLTNATRLYGLTNIWTVHLHFEPAQWAAIEPRPVEMLGDGRGRNGSLRLVNPAARRNGLAGARGLDFEWVHGRVEFEDRVFADAGVRYKGNGTYMRSQSMAKRPFKADLNKFEKGAELADRSTLNFGNLVNDDSGLHDTLAYEFYRDAGVPSPRTDFARLFTSVGAAATNYLGLYVLVENVDARFARERFGTREGALFKPSTTALFTDIGDTWDDYARIYDAKQKLEPVQSDRVIAFAKLVSHAPDEEFAARVGDYLELDAFARFLAATVLLSSYDSFLNNGQNFYLWLDPKDGRFQFIPWDLDNAWGRFGWSGSAHERAHASILHPWMGRHPLLERVMALPAFQQRYRAALTSMLDRVFIPERLQSRVDELAAVLRPVVAEEGPRKAARFEQAVTRMEPDADADSGGGGRGWGNRQPHPIKWFMRERAQSVRAQLDGTEDGIILERRR